MIHAIVMAGGKGTRFWPLSRAVKAKQFLNIIDQKPLINLTLERLTGLIPVDNRWIVGNAHQDLFLKEIPETLVQQDHIFLEPRGRNTAPCIAWAARHIHALDPEAVLVVLPADHWVDSIVAFQDTLLRTLPLAEAGKLVTVGISPTSPHTGYGYIQTQKTSDPRVFSVTSFAEKPDAETAAAYLKKGGYFWNAGMFAWRADVLLDQLKKHLPQNEPILDQLAPLSIRDTTRLAPLYETLLSISIDYAIMEKTADITALVSASFAWSDVGNWRELEHLWEKDKNGNAVSGEAILLNANRNIIYSEKKWVTAIDIDDLIIVDTADALLILPKTSDQKIKDLYPLLPEHIK